MSIRFALQSCTRVGLFYGKSTLKDRVAVLTVGLIGSDKQHKVSKGCVEEQKHHEVAKKDQIEGNCREQSHFLEITTEHLSQD